MRITLIVVASSLGLVLAAAADTLPSRKSGLWESTMKADEGSTTTKQCIDEKTDQLAQTAVNGPGGAGTVCSKNTVTKTGAGYETETVCKMGPISTEGKGVITGDFGSAIRMEMTILLSGIPGQSEPIARKTVIENRYLGPCEAGQKPGDIIMSDGKVLRTPGSPK